MLQKLSIVVPTYGRSTIFKRLVISLKLFLPPNVFEVIVVSSDVDGDSKFDEIIHDSRFKIIFADKRRSGGGRKKSLYYYTNLGISAATGDWILVANDDMFIDSDFWPELNREMNKHNFLSGGALVLNSQIGENPSLGVRIPILGEARKTKENKWEELPLLDVAVIDKKTLMDIGCFDENLDWYGSGLDNALKLFFLTDKPIVSAIKCTVFHDLLQPDRESMAGNSYADFDYLREKWKSILHGDLDNLVRISWPRSRSLLYKTIKKIQFAIAGARRN